MNTETDSVQTRRDPPAHDDAIGKKNDTANSGVVAPRIDESSRRGVGDTRERPLNTPIDDRIVDFLATSYAYLRG